MENYIKILNIILFSISIILLCIAFKKESKFWIKFKWYIIELIAMASNKPSYFSLKRINQIGAVWTFIAGWVKVLHMMIMNDIANPLMFNITNYIGWAGPLLVIGGYYLNKTQEEKVIYNKDQKIADEEVK